MKYHEAKEVPLLIPSLQRSIQNSVALVIVGFERLLGSGGTTEADLTNSYSILSLSSSSSEMSVLVVVFPLPSVI